MKQAFKIARGWAVLIWIVAPLLIALFVWITVLPFISNDTPLSALFIIIQISLIIITVFTVGLIDTVKGKSSSR